MARHTVEQMVDKSGPLGNNSAMSTATKQEEEMSPDASRCNAEIARLQAALRAHIGKTVPADVIEADISAAKTPVWQLPPPPAGQQWHRTDGWTQDMLPEVWRPLLKGEYALTGDEFFVNGKWHHQGIDYCYGENSHWNHHRTRRPLPQSAEPVVEEKSDDELAFLKESMERIAQEFGISHPMQLIGMAENNEETYTDILIKHIRREREKDVSERDRLVRELEESERQKDIITDNQNGFYQQLRTANEKLAALTAENAALKENLEAATHLVRRAVYATEHLRDLSRCPGMVEWLKNADAFLGAQESPPETEEQAMRREFEEWAQGNGILTRKEVDGEYASSATVLAWLAYQAARQPTGGRA